ncbi:MAG: hypothetical protein AAF804_06315 [Bacteroidota bacterium]
MDEYKQQLQDLADIRNLMESSSRFISLSGLSGVGAGLVALGGAFWVHRYLDSEGLMEGLLPKRILVVSWEQIYTLVGMAVIILLVAMGIAAFFTVRNTQRQGKKLWTRPAQRLMLNLAIPLLAGATFCLILAYHGFSSLVPGATLIFYGLGLLNAGKYTLREIRLLGLSEVALGLAAVLILQYSIVFWAFGFGVLHILYGGIMYFKYER